MNGISKGKVVAFCEKCNEKKKDYNLKKEAYNKNINGKVYKFYEYVAYCQECGEALDLPGLIDKNVSYMKQQYRRKEKIVNKSDMEKCLLLYNLSKDSLAKVLGIGEATIHRYFKGQIPSKEYSDRIRSVMSSFDEMNRYLENNKRCLTKISYNKVKKKIKIYESIFGDVEPKMIGAVSILIQIMREATNTQIQKLLYYCQGVFMGTYKEPLFESDCLAEKYGPVFSNVAELLKITKCYDADDEFMPLLQGYVNTLSIKERKTIVMVAKTFGNYSATPLIKMTHNELPWRNARYEKNNNITTNFIITKKSIQEYFSNVEKIWGLTNVNRVNGYIESTFNKH